MEGEDPTYVDVIWSGKRYFLNTSLEPYRYTSGYIQVGSVE